jgi:NO-binding membrane sensor protein with MHYT domain
MMGHSPPWRKIGSAFLMSAAICVMHYTGLATATQALRGSGCEQESGALIQKMLEC